MFIQLCMIAYGLYTGSKFVTHTSVKKVKKNRVRRKDLVTTNAPQVLEISPYKKNRHSYEKSVNYHLVGAASLLGVASLGSLYFPVLGLVTAVGSLCLSVPIFEKAFYALFYEKRLNRIEIVQSLAILILLASGFYLLYASANFIYYVAEKLRLMTENKAIHSISSIFSTQVSQVWLLKDGVEVEVPFDQLQLDDVIVVNAGEQIAADGLIVYGNASVDQHNLTGEAQPIEKTIGDSVFAATAIMSGKLHIQIKKAGYETTAAKIGELLKNTVDSTTLIESIGREISDESAPFSLGINVAALPILGFSTAVPLFCANFLESLRLTSPISMLNFIQIASHDGILIKDGRSLQTLAEIDVVVFDKTGTLTLELPHVQAIYTFNGLDEQVVLGLAAAAEFRQRHPIAKAILDAAENRAIAVAQIDEANYKVGYGISVKIDQQWIRVGSDRFMTMEGIKTSAHHLQSHHEEGCSLVYVAIDSELVGIIELRPTIRPEAKAVIEQLKHHHHMALYIISGDNEKPTQALAKELGISNYFAQVLPQDKAELVQKLQQAGKKVCFIGDGINDSIALKTANVSISLSGASTIAVDNAQIVLMDGSLEKLPALFKIASSFQANAKSIFLVASVSSVAGIGGVFFAHIGLPAMVALYSFSLASSLTVAMLPILKNKK
jgi:heavy metal translocating P-type ATPase